MTHAGTVPVTAFYYNVDYEKHESLPADLGSFYLGAWCRGGCGINPFGGTQPIFDFQRCGNPQNGGDDRGAKWRVYRLHTESPIAFQKNIRVTIEHGHANHRSDNFYMVAYWYQTEPHREFPPLPAVADRPRGLATGGPTTGRH